MNNGHSGEKELRYRELIEKVRSSYLAYDGPPDGKDPRLCWCDECREINLWAYWQGNLNAEILLAGQDWGCTDGAAEGFIQKIKSAKEGCSFGYMDGNSNPTDRRLVELFKNTFDIDILQTNERVFFTNFVLGYRNKGTSGGFKKDWIRHDKDFFRELVEIIEPKVILCLGRNTFEGVLTAFDKRAHVRIKGFNGFIESGNNPVSAQLRSGKTVNIFALAHCGNMGTLNRNQKKHMRLDAQILDWQRIKYYL